MIETSGCFIFAGVITRVLVRRGIGDRDDERIHIPALRPIVLLLMGLLIAVPNEATIFAQTTQSSAPETLGALSDSVRSLLAEENIPGGAVALVLPSGEIWSRGYGVANRATERLVTDSTLFRVGSVSKMFIGSAALQQQERGHLNLRDEVQELVPDLAFRNSWAEEHPLRLAHLLEHTAGFDGTHPAEIYAPHDSMSLRTQVNYHPHSQVVRWPPGRFTVYSDPGMNAAAYAVQRTAGQSFREYVDTNIFSPLEMHTVTYRYEEARRRGLAAGYRGAEQNAHIEYRPMTLEAAVGAMASVRDLARFVKMLLQRGRLDGTRILDSTSVRRMETPQTTLAAKRHGVRVGTGVGNYPKEQNGFLWHGHSGILDGHAASSRYLDEHDRGYVALFNGTNGNHDRIESLLADYLTRTLSPPPAPATSAERLSLSDYTGYYVSVTPRYAPLRAIVPWTRVLHVTATELLLRVDPLIETLDPARSEAANTWLPVGPGQFRDRDDPTATHAFMPVQGRMHLQVNGGGGGSFKRISAVRLWVYWGVAGAVFVFLASSLLYAFVWVPRAALGHNDALSDLQVRLWPLLATLGVVAFAAGLAGIIAHSANVRETFARPNLYSVGMLLGSVGLAVSSGIGIVQSLRYWTVTRSRVLWWHSFLTTVACLLVALWLAGHGLVGVRVWAY